jgi:hypothetical protein
MEVWPTTTVAGLQPMSTVVAAGGLVIWVLSALGP